MSLIATYLDALVDATSAAVEAAGARLVAQRAQLESLEPERLARGLELLGRKRLLASNTLMATASPERAAWDAANRVVAAQIATGEPWSVADVCAVNAAVTGTRGEPRDHAMFSCGLAYLGAEHVRPALERLETALRTCTRSPAVQGAIAYVGVVTIHPFANGNGRTARLAADRLLLASGHLPLCFLSPVASHVAQMEGGPRRDASQALELVLGAVEESYRTVLG